MKNIHPLQDFSQAEVMAYFLIKEMARHNEDITRCKFDLMALKAKWGINLKKIQERVETNDWIAP